MRSAAAMACCALLLSVGVALPAQTGPGDASAHDFLDRARASATALRDRDAAIAAGYRRVGMDFPLMGEHWVKPSVVTAGRVDPDHPSIVIYATIAGRPALVGVAFAVALGDGEHAPTVPGAEHAWHEHSGTVIEESLTPVHGGDAGAHEFAGGRAPRARLAVLHVWTALANPFGVFVAENPSLPFARLGLKTPPHVSADAARALSLACGGADYFELLLTHQGTPVHDAAALVASARARVVRIIANRALPDQLTAADLSELEDVGRGIQRP